MNILTRRFALELGGHGITVNAVAPGFTHTDMTRGGGTEAEWNETEAHFASVAMTGRIGEPDDIANAVAFFAAPDFRLDHCPGPGRGRRADGLHRPRLTTWESEREPRNALPDRMLFCNPERIHTRQTGS